MSEDDGSKRPSPYRPDRTPAKSSNVEEAVPAAAPTPNTTNATTATPAPAPPSAQDLRIPFDYVTNDAVATWNDGGSRVVVDAAAGADEMVLSEILQELTESCLRGRLTGKQVGATIRDIMAARPEDDDVDIASQFLDTISLLDEDHQRNPVLRSLVASTAIDPQTFRQELDIPLLQALGLVRETFEKMRTRKSTNILYKQANFNLLREESEGYAKLVTDYFNTVQDACSRRDENPHIAEDAFQRVKALVGAFDLDVGRVLDITLDVSANVLVKAHPFLMKFYRASSWWPKDDFQENIRFEDQGFSALPDWALPGSGRSAANEEEEIRQAMLRQTRDEQFWAAVAEKGMDAFFELGSRRIVDFESVRPLLETEIPPELDSRGKETNPEKRQYLRERRRYMLKTKTAPPPGNYDAAQLLGFKLRFYASPARNASDVLPDNLIKLAAFLIKIGFISLRDLYPHLHPSDEGMPAEKSRLEKEKAARDAKDRPGAGSNALAMAAALTDDTVPAARPTRAEKEKSGAGTPAQDKDKKEEVPKEELPTPENQKIQLLRALLLVGALPEAFHLLGRFPWLVEVDPSIPPLLHRIANHMLTKMSALAKPLADVDGFRQPREQVSDLTASVDGQLSFTARQLMRPVRWLHSDVHNLDDGIAYIHYYVGWNENIPVCQTLEDVFLLCNTFLGFLGLKVGQDVKLYGTLLRLAKNSLLQDDSEPNRARWLELMRRLLVPALSLSKHNPSLAQEVYDLLAIFPTSTRYGIYAEWFTGRTSRLPDMRAAFDRNKAEVRDVLRRVSNDTGKRQSRALAKVTMSSPGIVIMEMINQLESYSNMIPSLVECTRFFSSLAYDVLTWCLINSIGGQGRDRQQADGMLTSPWLQALSHFVASLFTKYSNLNPTPVLQYLAYELRSGNATDLALIEQLLVEMAGIRSDVEFNDAQVLAMAGGEYLQMHIMRQLSDARHTKDKSAKRLVRALAEPGLVGQILVAIAQEHQIYPDHEASQSMPLKVLGSNLDKIQAIFAQYLEVLKTNLKPEQFAEAVPDLPSLIADYGIEPGVAFTICRMVIRHRMAEYDAQRRQEILEEKRARAKAKAESNGDTAMADGDADEGGEEKNAKAETSEETPKKDSQVTESKWHPVLEPIIEDLANVAPELSTRVSVPFYVTFWTLMHQDLLVPTESYKREIDRIDSQIAELTGNRADMSAVALKERDRRKKSLQEARDRLSKETKPHMNAYMVIRARINGKENQHWFPKIVAKDSKQEHAEKDARHLGLLEECFLPRAMLSSVDAHFSFQMLKIMHDTGTPGFSLMHLLSQLFRKQLLASLMFQYTAGEAQHFGRFICETMKLLHRWHADRATYDKEALGSKKKLPGFVKSFDEKGEPKNVMDWEEFRRLLFNFHTFLYGALTACFESDEYMHVRNAIIVLKSVHVVFPMLAFQGKNMIEVVKKFSDKDTRSDLKLAAMSLLGPLKSGEKNWLTPQKFRLNDPSKEAARAAAGARSGSARPDTANSNGSSLDATATEFKPSGGARANGAGRKESVAGGKEDGEIEDAKQAADVQIKEPLVIATKIELVAPAETAEEPTRGRHGQAGHLSTANSRSGTPAHNGPRANQRGDSNRNTPVQAGPQRPPGHKNQSWNDRAPANKPPPRFNARADEGYGRLDRPNDVRPQSRDPSPASRGSRPRSPNAGGRGNFREDRQFERPSNDSRGPRDDNWQQRRDQGDSRSTPNTRPEPHGRSVDTPTHPERPVRLTSTVMLEPQSRPTSSGDAAESQVHVNPARLALINADAGGPPKSRESQYPEKGNRRERDSRQDERGPAPSFPPRSDSRQGPRGSNDLMRDHGSRQDPFADPAPTGPKRDRASRDYGQNLEYGRLNAPQDTPPSGPRQSNGYAGRGGRNSAAGPPHGRSNEPPAESPLRQSEPAGPPRGSMSRQPSTSYFDRPGGNSHPGTPSSEAPPSSRNGQYSQPPPLQTNFNAPNGPRGGASPTTGAPSGPRSTPRGAGAPMNAPSPLNSAPPSGPARRQERPRSTVEPLPSTTTPNNQGVNFRGASARQAGSAPFPSPGAPRSTVTLPPMDAPPPRQSFDNRPSLEELPSNQSNARPDLFQGKSGDWQGNHPHEGGGGRGGRRMRDDGGRQSGHDDSPAFRGSGPPGQPGMDDGRDRRSNNPSRQSRDGSPRGGGRRGGFQGGFNDRRPDMSGPPPAVPQWDRNNNNGPPAHRGGGGGGGSDDNRRASGRMSQGGPRGGDDFRGGGGQQQHMGQMQGHGGPPPQQQQQQQQYPQSDNRKRGPPPAQYDGPGSANKRRRNEREQ